MSRLHRVFLALGSNVGDKVDNIKSAVVLLGEKIGDIKLAPLYESKPCGYGDQDVFVNSVLYGNTNLSPVELLLFVKDIEKKIGRIKRFRNGPREIDVDILFYDDLVLDTPSLIIPHKEIPERDFVLVPLVDLEPDFIHPVFMVSVKKLLEDLHADRYIVGV